MSTLHFDHFSQAISKKKRAYLKEDGMEGHSNQTYTVYNTIITIIENKHTMDPIIPCLDGAKKSNKVINVKLDNCPRGANTSGK